MSKRNVPTARPLKQVSSAPKHNMSLGEEHRAVASLFSSVSDLASQRADIRVEAKAKEKAEEDARKNPDATFIPEKREGNTLKAQAYNQTTATLYQIRASNQVSMKLKELEAKHPTDLSAYQKESKEYLDGFLPEVQKVFPTIGAQLVAMSGQQVQNSSLRIDESSRLKTEDELVQNLVSQKMLIKDLTETDAIAHGITDGTLFSTQMNISNLQTSMLDALDHEGNPMYTSVQVEAEMKKLQNSYYKYGMFGEFERMGIDELHNVYESLVSGKHEVPYYDIDSNEILYQKLAIQVDATNYMQIKNKALSELSRKESAEKSRLAGLKEKDDLAFKEAVAQINATGETRNEFIPKSEKQLRALQEASTSHTAQSVVQNTTDDQIQALDVAFQEEVEAGRATQGDLDLYREKVGRELSAERQAIESRSYPDFLLSRNPNIEASAEAVLSAYTNPDTTPEDMQKVYSEYEAQVERKAKANGVNMADIDVLTTPMINALGARYPKPPTSSEVDEDMIEDYTQAHLRFFSQMETMSPDNYVSIMDQLARANKIPKEAQYISQIPLTDQQGRYDLARAISYRRNEGKSLFEADVSEEGEPSTLTQVQAQVREYLTPHMNTIAKDEHGVFNYQDGLLNSATTLAMYKMSQADMTPEEASEYGVRAFTNSYHYPDTNSSISVRIPNKLVSQDAESVIQEQSRIEGIEAGLKILPKITEHILVPTENELRTKTFGELEQDLPGPIESLVDPIIDFFWDAAVLPLHIIDNDVPGRQEFKDKESRDIVREDIEWRTNGADTGVIAYHRSTGQPVSKSPKQDKLSLYDAEGESGEPFFISWEQLQEIGVPEDKEIFTSMPDDPTMSTTVKAYNIESILHKLYRGTEPIDNTPAEHQEPPPEFNAKSLVKMFMHQKPEDVQGVN